MLATASSSCLFADLVRFGGGAGISVDEAEAALSSVDLGGLANSDGGGIVFGGCRNCNAEREMIDEFMKTSNLPKVTLL